MAANQIPTYVFDTVVPIAIVVMIYYLLDRLQRRSLSRPVHTALRATRIMLMIWGACLLVASVIGGMLSRIFFTFWEDYFLWVTIGSFSLVWSVVTLWEFRTQSSDVAVRVTWRSWRIVPVFIAIVVLAFAVMALIGYSYRDQQLGVASDKNIAPERLRAMYHSWHARMDIQVMKRLAGNTATPEDVLQQLAMHDDIAIRNNVCNNTAAPLSLLLTLVNEEERSLRLCVARHPNASEALLAQLTGDQSFAVRESVARNEAVPTKLLLKLSRDSHHSVRSFVAMNKATPAAALAILTTDKQQSIRHLVARHPALPLKQQLQLVTDSSVTVRRVVLSRSDVSREVLAKLENDPDETIRRLVQERYSQYRELEKQAGNRH